MCRRLLKAEQIDVSYFAAGIVAHLASDGAQSWHVSSTERQDILDELVSDTIAPDIHKMNFN